MKKVRTKNVFVGGDKIITAEAKAENGVFTDKFGNTVYITDSPENMERLKALKLKKKKVAKKKAVKKKAPKKRGATRKKATKKK